MQQNLISATLSDTVVADVTGLCRQIETLLAANLQNLEPRDRLVMAKMGDKTLAFVRKAVEYGQQNADYVPNYMNLTEAQSDLQLTTQLNSILKLLLPLCQSMQDTAMMAGSDAYMAGLCIYNHCKAAAANNVKGATTVAEDLSARFPGRSRKKREE